MSQSVKFEEIKNSCGNLQSLASNMKTTNGNINSITSKVSEPNWAGDAANNYRDKLQNLSNKLPDAQHQMAMSVLFLASCSDGYEILGKNNVNILIDLAGGQSAIDSINVNSLPDVDLGDRVKPAEESTTDTTPTVDDGTGRTTDNSGGYYVNSSYSTGAGAVSSAVTSSLAFAESTVTPGTEIKIPTNINQGPYTVTGYDYWIKSGKEMVWANGTNQRSVSNVWKSQGSKFKDGIAVVNVDGEDRYLVAVTTKFGVPGDKIDVKLKNGTTIPCVIGDSKGSDAGSEWGHQLGGSQINILEWEVERQTYLDSGNPTTKSWGLEWDSSSPVDSIKNNGSMLSKAVTV